MSWGIKEVILNPFGKNDLTENGVQYSAVVTNTTYAFTVVETATINIPSVDKILQIEYGLTMATNVATIETALQKWQGSDDNSSWVDLNSAVTASASTAYQDKTVSGRFPFTTNFLGKMRQKKEPFYIRAVSSIGSTSATTVTCSSKTKNSSYLKIIYVGY